MSVRTVVVRDPQAGNRLPQLAPIARGSACQTRGLTRTSAPAPRRSLGRGKQRTHRTRRGSAASEQEIAHELLRVSAACESRSPPRRWPAGPSNVMSAQWASVSFRGRARRTTFDGSPAPATAALGWRATAACELLAVFTEPRKPRTVSDYRFVDLTAPRPGSAGLLCSRASISAKRFAVFVTSVRSCANSASVMLPRTRPSRAARSSRNCAERSDIQRPL